MNQDEKRNWWVAVYDGNDNIVGEWLIEDRTEHDAGKEAEAAVDSMCNCELDDGGCVENWSMRIAVITIEVEKGCVVDVSGLPDGWDYTVDDHDLQEGA